MENVMALTLVIGNKNYSSWSMRPWIGMKAAGIAFTDRVISLDDPDFKSKLRKLTPAGKVPVLIDGDLHVWESLAILDYVADKFPAAGLWPQDMAVRARARSIAAEMHAGFLPLRRHCPMNIWRPVRPRALPPDVVANVTRIDTMWRECLERSGGPFLFGAWSAADAMYAPVVSRFHTYDVGVTKPSRRYMEAIMALPAWAEWTRAALAEPWVLPQDEVDWPNVLKVTTGNDGRPAIG
jgi:glutathione S-transferase